MIKTTCLSLLFNVINFPHRVQQATEILYLPKAKAKFHYSLKLNSNLAKNPGGPFLFRSPGLSSKLANTDVLNAQNWSQEETGIGGQNGNHKVSISSLENYLTMAFQDSEALVNHM